jgi:hypothetical protein
MNLFAKVTIAAAKWFSKNKNSAAGENAMVDAFRCCKGAWIGSCIANSF